MKTTSLNFKAVFVLLFCCWVSSALSAGIFSSRNQQWLLRADGGNGRTVQLLKYDGQNYVKVLEHKVDIPLEEFDPVSGYVTDDGGIALLTFPYRELAILYLVIDNGKVSRFETVTVKDLEKLARNRFGFSSNFVHWEFRSGRRPIYEVNGQLIVTDDSSPNLMHNLKDPGKYNYPLVSVNLTTRKLEITTRKSRDTITPPLVMEGYYPNRGFYTLWFEESDYPQGSLWKPESKTPPPLSIPAAAAGISEAIKNQFDGELTPYLEAHLKEFVLSKDVKCYGYLVSFNVIKSSGGYTERSRPIHGAILMNGKTAKLSFPDR